MASSKGRDGETVIFESNVSDNAGHEREFRFPIQVEPRVSNALRDSGTDSSAILAEINKMASQKVLSCGIDWKCVICSEPATTSVNTPMSFSIDRSKPIYIRDCCFFPICGNPACDFEARRRTEEIMGEVKKTYASFGKAQSVRCWECGKIEKVQGTRMSKCSRCKVATYCNADCQTKHWKKEHKKKCTVPPKTGN